MPQFLPVLTEAKATEVPQGDGRDSLNMSLRSVQVNPSGMFCTNTRVCEPACFLRPPPPPLLPGLWGKDEERPGGFEGREREEEGDFEDEEGVIDQSESRGVSFGSLGVD